MASIPALEQDKTLPLSFRLLTAKPINPEEEPPRFFWVDGYQGLALAKVCPKPISKIVRHEQSR